MFKKPSTAPIPNYDEITARVENKIVMIPKVIDTLFVRSADLVSSVSKIQNLGYAVNVESIAQPPKGIFGSPFSTNHYKVEILKYVQEESE